MSITGIGNNYNNPSTAKNPAQGKMSAKEGISSKEKRSVILSISDEGKEYYRNSIRQEGQECYEAVLQRKEQLKGIGMIDYSLELQKKAAANTGANGLSTGGKANGYLNAYAELYDEIVQGYENGTREIYAEAENGTHKLTKDEELCALDAAYQKTVDDFVVREKTNHHAREIISGEMKKISRISLRSNLSATYLEEQKTRGTDEIPDNLNEMMYHAADLFKESYAMLNSNADRSQLLLNIKIF